MVDLHTHSTASDGSLSPPELVRAARDVGLTAVALTDHDTVAGLAAFMEAGADAGIDTVPGVELACRWYTINLHIVGLDISVEAPSVERLAAGIRRARDVRNRQMVERLRHLGLPISIDIVEEEAGGESIGRPHVARALVRAGCCRTVPEAFERWLARGRPAYVRRQLPGPHEVISAIHDSGGAAIWAHPAATRPGGPARLRQVVRRLAAYGLDGMEVLYPEHTPKQERVVKQIVEEFGLVPSGGSDFHGANVPGVRLGTGRGRLAVPDEWLDAIRTRALRYKR